MAQPGDVTTSPSGQQYIFFGNSWGPGTGVSGGNVVPWDSLPDPKPDGSTSSIDQNDVNNADGAEIESDHLYENENKDINDYYGSRKDRLESERVNDANAKRASNNKAARDARYGRFSIEAAVSKYAKDRFLKGPTRKKRKIQDGILRYPLQALTSSTDYLQIDIGNYEPVGERYINTPGSSKRYVTSTSRGSSNSTAHLSTRPLINAGTILLPIPSQIKDTNTAAYNDSKMNGMAATAAGALEDVMDIKWDDKTDIVDELQKIGGNAFNEAAGGVGNIDFLKARLKKQFAAQAISLFDKNINPEDMLARSNGEILNPHMELLFSGPTLRNFRFSFKFTPRNELEAQQVKLIIRAFKQNMAPKVRGSAGGSGSGSWFLKTPNIFKIQYKSGNRNHPFLNKFKQCFLTNVDTSYTADGTYTTYDDGTPTSMLLDLAFKETEPIYDDDYDEGPGTEGVGY